MKIIAKNRKARYNYFLFDRYQAGMSLLGTEVKSIKNGDVNLGDAYVIFNEAQQGLFIVNMHVSEYSSSNLEIEKIDPLRSRRLLLNQKEINKIVKQIKLQRVTVIPTMLFLNRKGFIKIEIYTAKGKKLHDKRESLKEEEAKKEKITIRK